MRVGDDRRVAVLDRVDVELGQLDRRRGSAGRASQIRWPTSEREVACRSSRRGWRQTSSAASAPAKPEAPATRTRAAGSPSSGCSRLPAISHGARPRSRRARRRSPRGRSATSASVRVRSASRNSSRSARLRLPLGHLLALVDVEDRGGAQQLAAGLDRPGADPLGAIVARSATTAMSSAMAGMGRDVLVELARRRSRRRAAARRRARRRRRCGRRARQQRAGAARRSSRPRLPARRTTAAARPGAGTGGCPARDRPRPRGPRRASSIRPLAS